MNEAQREALFIAHHATIDTQPDANARRIVATAQAMTFTCYDCGQSGTADMFDSSGTDLCLPCYDAAGLENEHSDNGHADPVTGCPTCEAAR